MEVARKRCSSLSHPGMLQWPASNSLMRLLKEGLGLFLWRLEKKHLVRIALFFLKTPGADKQPHIRKLLFTYL